jgi:AraC-like DNA-binding protein
VLLFETSRMPAATFPRRACAKHKQATAIARERFAVPDRIAAGYGFCETNSFTTAFRRETGLTPSSYRRSFV